MSELQVEVVAADKKVWEGTARLVVARSTEGDLGIMPGHTPMLGVLVTGDVRIEGGEGGSQTFHIDSGFLSVDNDRVVIVAETVAEGSGQRDTATV